MAPELEVALYFDDVFIYWRVVPRQFQYFYL